MKVPKAGKILIWILALLVSLFIVCYVLLRIPTIQTRVVKKISATLSSQLGATVYVDRVNLKFFRRASLHDVYLEDLGGDTLFYAKDIDATISLFQLFGKRLVIDQLATNDVKIYLARNAQDARYNFQFILDHFATDRQPSARPWNFKLDRVKIVNGRLKLNDEYTGNDVECDIGSFSIFLDDLDNINKSIRVSQFGLGDSYLSIAKDGEVFQDTSSLESYVDAIFPYSGWDIVIKQIRLEENDFKFRNHNIASLQSFNPADLDLTDVSFFMDDFIWTSSALSGHLTALTMADKSGFSLENLSTKILATDAAIFIDSLKLLTSNSEVNAEANISFSSFRQMKNFSDSVSIYAQFTNSKIDYKDLKLLIPNFNKLHYVNPDQKEKININGRLLGTLNDLQLDKLRINARNLMTLNMDGRIKNMTSSSPIVLDLNIGKLATSYGALNQLTKNVGLPKGLATWNDFLLSGKIKGRLQNLFGQNIKLTTSSVTRFEGDFHITGLPNIEQTIFDIDVVDLRSVSTDLSGFSENKLPAALDSLGQFYYAGKFKGTIYDFVLNGALSSAAGSLKTDIKMNFQKDFKNASYSGDLLLESFDLGKVLARDDLKSLSMDVNVFGTGLQTEDLRATVLGEVQDLEYKGYHYRDIIIDGRFDKKQFAGHASVEDPNIALDFEGVVNLSDSLSRFRFNAKVDTINFTNLGFLTPQLGVKGKIAADFRGKNADSMKGNITSTKLSFSNLEEHFMLDSLLIFSDDSQQHERSLEVRSDLIKGQINGKFALQDLPVYFADYFNKYFPFDLKSLGKDTLLMPGIDTSFQSLVGSQDFTFDWSFTNMHQLLGLVDPKLEKLDTILLGGRVIEDINSVEITGFINRIEYDGMNFGPITLTSSGDEGSVDHVVTIKNSHLADGLDFPYIRLDMTMVDDSAFVGVLLEDAKDTIQEKLNLAALITPEDGKYLIKLSQNMVLNGSDWQINPKHFITYIPGDLQIADLVIQKDSQQIEIGTNKIAESGIESSAVTFHFDKFQLNEVSKLLEVEDAIYDGQLNGVLTLRKNGKKMNYLADLSLNQLTLKEENIGNLMIKSQQRTDDLLDLIIKLEGGISGLDVRGTYNRTNSAIQIQGEIDQLGMKNLDPFLNKYIRESTGKLSGSFTIGGSVPVPVIDGVFELEKISTLIDYLDARYSFANEEIRIEQNNMNFRDFNLTDQSGNKAVINGQLDFKDLVDPKVNLKFKTDRFLVLNTPPDAKKFFYGKLFVGGDVSAGGTLSSPTLQVNASALDSTDFVLQPLLSNTSIQQEDFIIFANPEDYRSDTSISIQDFYKIEDYNINLSVNLECTPDAQLTIVVDPVTGDKLVCRGNGNLVIDISPDGNANIRGNYLITQGQYAFNFQRVIKRTFEIDPGSQVTFMGDILQSRFDILASYVVRTSTYELIKNQSTLSSAEEVGSRQRSEVQVKLKLTGNLEKPVAKFDIEIDENSGAGATSSVSTKLAQMREDESAMNKQVFGLLIFNSFLAEEQNSNASLLSDAGQSAILSSVSNLLSNELNRLAKRYIKGVDLDFGVNSYSSNFDDGNSLITELKVGLSKRLLNDRLTVKLGGNLQLENTAVEVVNNQNSTFSGDFALEYKLSADGNYNLKFFQILSNGENIFSPGVNYSETGVSVFFTKSFNSKRYQLQLNEQ